MKECVFFNEIIFFIQYNLPQLEHTYSNDPPIILYHLCNDFPEALQNTVPRLHIAAQIRIQFVPAESSNSHVVGLMTIHHDVVKRNATQRHVLAVGTVTLKYIPLEKLEF